MKIVQTPPKAFSEFTHQIHKKTKLVIPKNQHKIFPFELIMFNFGHLQGTIKSPPHN